MTTAPAIPATSGKSVGVFLKELQLNDFLSFGERSQSVPLQSLNILIGANGSGKSNFIDAIRLLQASPDNLADTIRQGGGVTEWIRKGTRSAIASVSANIHLPGYLPLTHILDLSVHGQHFFLFQERIQSAEIDAAAEATYFDLFEGAIRITDRGISSQRPAENNKSILAQFRDPISYPQLTQLSREYSDIRIYREWTFGRNTLLRQPQPADMRNDRLEEDFSNLGLFLNRLRTIPQAKRAIISHLRDLYEGVDDFDISVVGGTVQIFLTEDNIIVPATRLSDGTLRYLCLLAILCDPNPPSLICIEEPELGLHPDMMPKIADLLVEASSRTQLIVTTHSDILVDTMTERPESVLVCEKQHGQTMIKRLSSDELSLWLEKYRLGELWMRGEIGGTRW